MICNMGSHSARQEQPEHKMQGYCRNRKFPARLRSTSSAILGHVESRYRRGLSGVGMLSLPLAMPMHPPEIQSCRTCDVHRSRLGNGHFWP